MFVVRLSKNSSTIISFCWNQVQFHNEKPPEKPRNEFIVEGGITLDGIAAQIHKFWGLCVAPESLNRNVSMNTTLYGVRYVSPISTP